MLTVGSQSGTDPLLVSCAVGSVFQSGAPTGISGER